MTINNTMSNYSIKLDLLKLKGAGVTNIKGRTATKKCLVIPIEDARLFLGGKGVYLDLSAWESREQGKYGDTHGVKQSFSKETLDAMSEEERKALPFLGNMRPMQQQTAQPMAVNGYVSMEDDPDLPF